MTQLATCRPQYYTTKVYIKLLTYCFKGSALSIVNVLLTNTIEDCVCTYLYIIMYV